MLIWKGRLPLLFVEDSVSETKQKKKRDGLSCQDSILDSAILEIVINYYPRGFCRALSFFYIRDAAKMRNGHENTVLAEA